MVELSVLMNLLPFEALFSGYARLGETIGRQLESVVWPSYFGGLERLSRQLKDAARPRHLDVLGGLTSTPVAIHGKQI